MAQPLDPLQADANRRPQLVGGERLGEVVIGPLPHPPAHVVAIGQGGQEDEGDAAQGGNLAQLAVQPEPVEARHGYVADDEIGGGPLLEGFEGQPGIVEAGDLKPGQDLLDQRQIDLVVVDGGNVLHFGGVRRLFGDVHSGVHCHLPQTISLWRCSGS